MSRTRPQAHTLSPRCPRRIIAGCVLAALAATSASFPAPAIADSLLGQDGLSAAIGDFGRVRLMTDSKFHVRHTFAEELDLKLPLPSDFFPPDGVIAMRPPDKGTSFEVSNVALATEAEIGSLITARVNVHFIDLYNRNPTSTADEIRVREAWLRVGRDLSSMVPIVDTGAYIEVGRAPRFTKQIFRRLESYGLWGTAVGRFEEDQVQAGASLGQHVYVKASVANGNPVFFRDVNALAGDNGTPNRSRGNVHPEYQSGFPMLYDAFPNDVNLDGKFQYGGGIGARFLDADGRDGIDVLGWYFGRELSDSVDIDGSFYGGDLDPLSLTPREIPELPTTIGFPTSGDHKWETGLNVEGRLGHAHVFAQYVYQAIADLDRHGVELELAYRQPLDGLVNIGGVPALNWIEPVFRFSSIHAMFDAPAVFPSKSLAWNWFKYDLGFRVGIVRGIDLTWEYSHTDTNRDVDLDEILTTLRVGL